MSKSKVIKRQYVKYTIKDMETGDKKILDDFRPVSKGLRAPNMDGRYRIVAAKVIGVY